jgi:hypothetical protein
MKVLNCNRRLVAFHENGGDKCGNALRIALTLSDYGDSNHIKDGHASSANSASSANPANSAQNFSQCSTSASGRFSMVTSSAG